ncbi:MAG TPA: hypothetical protein VGF94_15370 [Kofleriaceae bacterium]|jgi:Mg2+/citrate symporter
MTKRAFVGAFIALELLAAVSWLCAGTMVPIVIAFVMAFVSATWFMELRVAHPVHRAAAIAMLFFIALLCAGISADAGLR